MTVRYTDLTGNLYEHDWDVDSAAYEGAQRHRGMDELVATVEGLARGWETGDGPGPAVRSRVGRSNG